MFHVKCCSTYAYNWVHSWFLQCPQKMLYRAWHIYFQHYTVMCLLWWKCIYLSLSTSFLYHMLLNTLCLNLLHKSTLACHTCTYTFDIQCMSHTSLIYMRHTPQYELLLTNTLYNLLLLSFSKQYYSARLIYVMKSVHINRNSVTYCLFLAIFMVSLNQLWGVEHHLFHHENCKELYLF